MPILSYNITCNHVHVIAYAENPGAIATLMQQAAGQMARDYNRRKGRSGAFWEGRYHATMVGSGEYLWDCIVYVELNMVRCGVVNHPCEWDWSGYGELMGQRKRNRLLDVEKLLWLLRCGSVTEFREHLNTELERRILNDELERQSKWTQAIAVGERAFVEAIEAQIKSRRQMVLSDEGNSWVLREEYDSILGPEKRAMSHSGGLFLS
jgi:putative transposase